jgi:hypothetical protein
MADEASVEEERKGAMYGYYKKSLNWGLKFLHYISTTTEVMELVKLHMLLVLAININSYYSFHSLLFFVYTRGSTVLSLLSKDERELI